LINKDVYLKLQHNYDLKLFQLQKFFLISNFVQIYINNSSLSTKYTIIFHIFFSFWLSER